MHPIDLNVQPTTPADIEQFEQMARELGFVGLASSSAEHPKGNYQDDGFFTVKRQELANRQLSHLKKILSQIRTKSLLVSLPLGSIDGLNWAAGDGRIDLITLDGITGVKSMRASTAKLAAESGTCLEVTIAPLIGVSGLGRSKILKYYREAISTACDVGMSVIISSGARNPLQQRSPMALAHIGQMLGLEFHAAREAVFELPYSILERNKRKISDSMVAPGVEIVQGGEEE